MPYLNETDIYDAYTDACDEAIQWRADYPEFERLMENGLMDQLDPNLPEVNDGSLAASLFKLAKRNVKKEISGRAVALDATDAWITELANLQWTKNILPNAKTKASPRRKWKDIARKAAALGSQPVITFFGERGSYRGADFIAPYAQDVKLEAGKDSDEDSDIIFWDVYYSKLQVENLIETAKAEQKQAKENKETDPQSFNKWYIKNLEEILAGEMTEDRPGNEESRSKMDKGVKKTGFNFMIAFQRGVNAPFLMCHPATRKPIREWSNQDPTGDLPVHYLYFYQDFINPYGIGVVKLAGGTQNVLDYMRQADVLATQLGLRPPKMIRGDTEGLDEESMVYTEDANWYVGQAIVERQEMANGVYSQLPGRISMYKTSLNQIVPTGDTSISGTDSGDPQYSKTPAGVKFQAQALSVDDEDFSENVLECQAATAKSMINIHFANMQGTDLMKLSDDERMIMINAGIQWPTDPATGEPVGNELDVIWDQARATFDFEVDPDADKTQDEQAALEGKLKAYELINSDPNIDMLLMQNGKKLNRGELLSDIFSTLTDNDKIIQDISAEEKQMAAGGVDPATGQPMMQPGQEAMPPEQDPNALTDEESLAGQHIDMVMQEYGVDEQTATAMLEAERQGFEPEEILQYMQGGQQPAVANA